MYFHFNDINNEGPEEFFSIEKDWNYSWSNFRNDENSKYCTLGAFRQVNLFVGANNSGKSRFLRGILKSSKEFASISRGNIGIADKHKEVLKCTI